MRQVEFNGKRMELEAVVFDMDGLMFDSERVVMYSWNVAGEQLGYGNLGENIYHTLGMGAALRERYFKEKYGSSFPYERFKELYRDAFYDYEAREGISVKPGLSELLQFLKEKQIPVAMASSTSGPDVKRRLKCERLEGFFSAVITGDMVRETKPSPEIYQRACHALQVNPAHAIALEDACNGILSAHRAGMCPIMIPDLQKDTSAVEQLLFAKMETLQEVADWLKACFPEIP